MTATFERAAKGLLGTKLGMTQLWDENNRVVPVTVVAAATNVVTQVRRPETDGFISVLSLASRREIGSIPYTVPPSAISSQGNTPRQIQLADEDLRRNTRFESPRITRDPAGLLVVTVPPCSSS